MTFLCFGDLGGFFYFLRCHYPLYSQLTFRWWSFPISNSICSSCKKYLVLPTGLLLPMSHTPWAKGLILLPCRLLLASVCHFSVEAGDVLAAGCWDRRPMGQSTSSLASLTQPTGLWVSGVDYCAWPGSGSTLDPTRLPQVQRSKVSLLSVPRHTRHGTFSFSHICFFLMYCPFFQNRLLPTLPF